MSREWFRDWFGDEYLAVYPHRDAAEAREAVELYVSAVAPAAGRPVLDVACGAGRHLRELHAAGLTGVGLDLSMPLLRRARGFSSECSLARGDMRHLPFADGVFAGVTSFFTSFGYFADPEDDRRVLREMRRVLETQGSFMLDFLNSERVRRELVPEDTRDVHGIRVVQQRSIEGEYVVKSIRIESSREAAPQTYIERVRLYSAAELTAMLREAGLEPMYRYGDYGGGPLDADSPRLILAGRAGRRAEEEA